MILSLLLSTGSAAAAAEPLVVEDLSAGRSSPQQLPQQRDMAATSPQNPVNQPFREPILAEDEAEEDDGQAALQEVLQSQILQEEVQVLRGLVEEIQAELRELKQRQADRYVDLDRRMQALRSTLDERAPSAAAADAHEVAAADPTPSSAVAEQLDEKQLYDTALQLIRTRQFELAIKRLQQVIERFPEGAFTANANYWLGEAYLATAEPDLPQARLYFAQVISNYPDHRKIPDAAYKLGVVTHLIGDCERARELLAQVRRDYEGRSVAGLADSYLRDKVRCDSPPGNNL